MTAPDAAARPDPPTAAPAGGDASWLGLYRLAPGQRIAEFDDLALLVARACGVPAVRMVATVGDAAWDLGRFDDPEMAVATEPVVAHRQVPLRSPEGWALGQVAVIGPSNEALTAAQQGVLAAAADHAQRILARRRELASLEARHADLNERQEAFEQSMEIAGETFWDWDLRTNHMGHARNRARMLGYDPADMAEHLEGWVAVSHPDDQEPVAQAIRAHLAGQTPEYEAEYRQRHRDGHWVWVRSRGRVIERDPATGKALRLRGTVVDITRRKELESRITQMNEDLLQLVRSLPDAVLHKDTQGHWLYANAAAVTVFGPDRDDPPEEAEQQAWATRSVQTRLETYEVQGRRREYEVQRVPVFDVQGQPRSMVVIARDLWHQREQEDIQRRALEQAEEAARSKAQFLATMAHEIRTPLNSVVGASRLALMEEDPQEQAAHLELVHQASQMLLDLLNTVLDHSRLESGTLQLENAPVSVRHLLHQIGQQMGPAARAKGLQWSTRVDPAVPAAVLGDSLRLRQVLTNLVGNAVKFTEQGGITVQAQVSPAEAGRVAMVSIEVLDTGIGLTAEQQARLFKAFSQADASIARRYGGTGLGLSISRQIMQALGGRLTLTSERGQGSCFRLQWPLRAVGPVLAGEGDRAAVPWPPVALDEPVPAAQGRGERGADLARQLTEAGRELAGRVVMVVDDNRMNVLVVRRLLERAGLQVVSATSGSEALALLAKQPVDLVLLDLYMPEMNGDEVAQRIRRVPSLQRLPVIALSASVTLEERDRCAAAGMDDFVSKPIDPLELLSAMADCLAP